MSEHLEKELGKLMDEAVKDTKYAGQPQRPQLRAMPIASTLAAEAEPEPVTTLAENLRQLESIETKLWDRLHDARLKLEETFTRKMLDIQSSFARELQEQRVRLERRRDAEVRALEDSFQQKQDEFQALIKRLTK
jgi:hypothetical protein